MGAGRFADKLSYEDWFKFNCAQRAHYNFMEQMPPLMLFLIISGLYFPFIAGIIGCGYFLARIMFTLGYMKSPNKRRLGGLFV
jgi:glutathione S-transferase